jgi:hypothetical protein
MNKVLLAVMIIAGVIILPMGWYLASPLFLDNVVDEENPLVIGENSSQSASRIIYQGEFVGAGDGFHEVSGKAFILEVNGSQVLRFENFTATNGPDLKVYLSKDTSANDYVSLGRLKGNIGSQNYDLTEMVDLEEYSKVLIWCERFSVLFGHSNIKQINS